MHFVLRALRRNAAMPVTGSGRRCALRPTFGAALRAAVNAASSSRHDLVSILSVQMPRRAERSATKSRTVFAPGSRKVRLCPANQKALEDPPSRLSARAILIFAGGIRRGKNLPSCASETAEETPSAARPLSIHRGESPPGVPRVIQARHRRRPLDQQRAALHSGLDSCRSSRNAYALTMSTRDALAVRARR